MFSRVLHSLLFAAGLFGTAAWIQHVEPTPFLSWARHKIEHVERLGEGYDTLFLGSSRMNYGLDPARFDARMKELGRPTKSFNLALSGHRQHDVGAVVTWLLAHKPASLRRVVIELHSFAQLVRAGDWMSDQELEMHTAGEFVGRCHSILLGPSPWTDKVLQFRFVFAHTLTNVLRVGQAPRILDDWIARSRGEGLPLTYPPPHAGWAAVEDLKLPHVLADHERFVSGKVDVAGVVAQRVQDVAPPYLRGGFNFASIRAQAAALRAAGIEPVYVVMPSFSQDNLGRDGAREFAREARVLELDRPDAHRPLYETALYYDSSQFGTAGAAVFSPYLAELLVECEGQPAGFAPKPRTLPTTPMRLQATRTDGGIALVAENLPFVGQLVVVASTEPADAELNGLRVRVKFPPRWTCELARSQLLQAKGMLQASDLPGDQPVFLQLGVIVEGATVALGEQVRVDPR
jgi:hypothetical protein